MDAKVSFLLWPDNRVGARELRVFNFFVRTYLVVDVTSTFMLSTGTL